MILYIFGAGHGADEILEDSVFSELVNGYIFVEDNPHDNNIVSTDSIISKAKYGIVSTWSPTWKAKLDKLFPNINWISAISPRANIMIKAVGLNARSGSIVSSSVKIGRHVRINFNSNIGCDSQIGNYSFIAMGCSMLGNSRLGNGSILYSHSVVLPSITVGNNTVIGAGSVVTKDIPDNVIAYGSPCKVVRENE